MEFSALAAFIGGYLHQDWDLEYSTPVEAAADFGRSESLELVLRALGEGALLLASGTDGEVSDWITSSGCYVVVPQGTSAHQWLQSMLDAIASSAVGGSACDDS
jgi:hypothetical protein